MAMFTLQSARDGEEYPHSDVMPEYLRGWLDSFLPWEVLYSKDAVLCTALDYYSSPQLNTLV